MALMFDLPLDVHVNSVSVSPGFNCGSRTKLTRPAMTTSGDAGESELAKSNGAYPAARIGCVSRFSQSKNGARGPDASQTYSKNNCRPYRVCRLPKPDQEETDLSEKERNGPQQERKKEPVGHLSVPVQQVAADARDNRNESPHTPVAMISNMYWLTN